MRARHHAIAVSVSDRTTETAAPQKPLRWGSGSGHRVHTVPSIRSTGKQSRPYGPQENGPVHTVHTATAASTLSTGKQPRPQGLETMPRRLIV